MRARSQQSPSLTGQEIASRSVGAEGESSQGEAVAAPGADAGASTENKVSSAEADHLRMELEAAREKARFAVEDCERIKAELAMTIHKVKNPLCY